MTTPTLLQPPPARRRSATFEPAPPRTALLAVIDAAFPHSRPDSRSTLAATASVGHYEVGQTIRGQEDVSSVVLAVEGRVAVRRVTVDGRQLIVAIVKGGGLASVLPMADRPAPAEAVAITPSVAATWHATLIRSLSLADAGLAIDILDQVLVAYEGVIGRLDGMLRQNAVRRLARVLHVHADLFFGDRPVLARAYLPDLVGTSREMTGRVLRLLESQGIVARVGSDGLRLLDPARLATAAEYPP
jgi:CRP-like cAMP-binding protein